MNARKPRTSLVWKAHAAYYIVGSIWPLVSGRTFEWVTGKKQDMWLVKTVALLLCTVGAGVGSAGVKNRITPEITGIAAGSAASLAMIDIINVGRGRISKVYLLDALGNIILIGGWIAAIRENKNENSA